MPISLKAEFGDDSTILIEFPVILPSDEESYYSNIQVTIFIAQRGKPGQPDHWMPPYREAQEIKFSTSANVLREFMRNLEKLL